MSATCRSTAGSWCPRREPRRRRSSPGGGLPDGARPVRSSASASSSSAPSSERPVFSRNTSSSEGWWSCRSETLMPSASSARTTSASASAPAARRTATLFGLPAAGSPNGASEAARRSLSFGFTGVASSATPPISAFSADGVPSATIFPWSMIPTRSASTSASSRYCVVRKTVTPSSRASRSTSAHSALRLCGSRPVVGSSRKSTRGPCSSASARSRRRFMPPEYPPTLRPAASLSPTRSSSASPRVRHSAFDRPCRPPWRSMCSQPVRKSSSAASWSAAPMVRRISGPCVVTSRPATLARPPDGGSSVTSISTVVDLPAPFGPRKP